MSKKLAEMKAARPAGLRLAKAKRELRAAGKKATSDALAARCAELKAAEEGGE
jgi:hypothetical protein